MLRMGFLPFVRPRVGLASNAVFQNQIVAVLLHRIDEELLCGNLLHRNTSYLLYQRLCRGVIFLSGTRLSGQPLASGCRYYSIQV